MILYSFCPFLQEIKFILSFVLLSSATKKKSKEIYDYQMLSYFSLVNANIKHILIKKTYKKAIKILDLSKKYYCK